MTDDELVLWFELTDHLPPEELLPAESVTARMRLFVVPEDDPRHPVVLVQPRLIRGAPRQVQRDLLAMLATEVTGSCPMCGSQTAADGTTRHGSGCDLADFPRRVRGWLMPGTLEAVAVYGMIGKAVNGG